MKIETNKIKLVDLRVYRKGMGVEVDEEMPKALVFLNNNDNRYHNLIKPDEHYPLMKRVPYSNTTADGFVFGTKLSVENPSHLEEVGICAIECEHPFIEKIRLQKTIDIKEVEDFILSSDLYFKDRVVIIERRINNGAKKRRLMKISYQDWDKNCHYQDNIFDIHNEIKKLKK